MDLFELVWQGGRGGTSELEEPAVSFHRLSPRFNPPSEDEMAMWLSAIVNTVTSTRMPVAVATVEGRIIMVCVHRRSRAERRWRPRQCQWRRMTNFRPRFVLSAHCIHACIYSSYALKRYLYLCVHVVFLANFLFSK
jgi:hypothetical protein